MEIVGKKILEKLKRKNKGNIPLIASIEGLIKTLEDNQFTNQSDILKVRPDADCVHSDGFYFSISIFIEHCF